MRMNGKCVLRCMAIAALASMASCHSTEANYKAAYDKAVNRTKDGVGLEVYNKVIEERNRDNYIVNGDSLRMVLDRCNIEQFAEVAQGVATEVVVVAGSTESAEVVHFGLVETVKLYRLADARDVEGCIVCNQHGRFVKILNYLSPHLGKLGCMGGVLGLDAVHLNVYIGICITFGTDEP